jgi:hypothetical protein
MNVEIGAEAALFPEKEYINGIFVAVYSKLHCRESKPFLFSIIEQIDTLWCINRALRSELTFAVFL